MQGKERDAQMETLFSPFRLKGLELKNRICVPPLVCYTWSDDTGRVSEKNIAHYRAIAQGGPGLIIQEATCISREGRLSGDQLGIWEDGQIEGLKKIVDAAHNEGCPIFIQLHHAGIMSIGEENLCPSDYSCEKNGKAKIGRAMTEEEIQQVKQQFVEAGRRAFAAGYDGIEIHGCHQYLLCQFFNTRINRRQDAYGREPSRLALEVYRGIRAATSPDYIIGIRLGAFEPTLADGIAHAREMEAAGLDFLDISYGFNGEDEPAAPPDFPYKDVIYGAGEIKKQVGIPVFAVNSIRSAEDAEGVLRETGVDMVNIGRGVVVNDDWAMDAAAGRDTGRCLDCKACQWRINPAKCPGRILHERRRTEKG